MILVMQQCLNLVCDMSDFHRGYPYLLGTLCWCCYRKCAGKSHEAAQWIKLRNGKVTPVGNDHKTQYISNVTENLIVNSNLV